MRKITSIQASLQALKVLTPAQAANVKGGLDPIIDPLAATLDDKRRERPGGGVSTQ